MYIGKSKSAGMGARRDFGLKGQNGKGSATRTNLASPAWQKNYDGIFRKKPKPPRATKSEKFVRVFARAVAAVEANETRKHLEKALDRITEK